MSEVKREERTEDTAHKEIVVAARSSPLDSIDRGLSAIERWLGYFGMICLIGLMAMVVFEVVARYVFNHPMQGYIDIMEMMMVLLVFLSLAYCQREEGHIRMEIFMTRVLVRGRRYHAAEFFHLLISLAGFGLIAVFAVVQTLHAREVGDSTMTIYLPTWPVRMLAATGAIFLCLRFVLQMFQSARYVLFGVREPEKKEGLESIL